MVTVAEQREQANKLLKNLIELDVDSAFCAETLMIFFKLERPEIADVLIKHEVYPYYLTKNGNFISILVVSNRPEEYAEDLRLSQSGIVYAYVYNLSQPNFSEFGMIKVDNHLRRIA
ncbi:hypothetical protein AALT52_00650 [Ligilactobacillus faecis]|uniref:Uncharacterized protein n=1 Tax=Ligilactobacillus faecis TaxID=762833 RepID=A0ABV4DLP6_9LACO